jgi:hypothetical protein
MKIKQVSELRAYRVVDDDLGYWIEAKKTGDRFDIRFNTEGQAWHYLKNAFLAMSFEENDVSQELRRNKA